MRISVATRQERTPALRRLFGDVEKFRRPQRVWQAQLRESFDDSNYENLLVARRRERLVGAIQATVGPGANGGVWLPRIASDEPERTADRLLNRVEQRLARHGVKIATAGISSLQNRDAERLRRVGYRHAITFLTMSCDRSQFPTAPPVSDLEVNPYDPDDPERLARVLALTYEDSLDLPELIGARTSDEVIEQHLNSGRFDPANWLIFRYRGNDVGCALVADYPREDRCEVSYVGLGVEGRGRGFGQVAIRHAQCVAARAGRGRLVLYVDVTNTPALKTYERTGFRVVARGHALSKVLSPA